MERGQADQPSSMILGSLMMFDEQEVLFRATWRPLNGFFNISLWRDGRVVETFHLTPGAASDLLSFVTRAFVSSVPAPSSHLHVVPSSDSPRPDLRAGAYRPASVSGSPTHSRARPSDYGGEGTIQAPLVAGSERAVANS